MSDQDRYRGEIFKYAECKLEFSLLAECDMVGESSISRSHGIETAFSTDETEKHEIVPTFRKKSGGFHPCDGPQAL